MRPARSSSTVAACTPPSRFRHDGSSLDLGRDLGQVSERIVSRRHALDR
jgi:hypothetical protein